MFGKMLVKIFVILLFATITTATFAQGHKTGLFVGINSYPNGHALKSCVRDATNMQSKLVDDFGFKNTTLLTDNDATRQGIMNKLKQYETQTARGDLFVFYYSGHGSLFPDALSIDKDETEQISPPKGIPTGYYDSAIVPVDAEQTTSGKAWGNFIIDDEINEIFSRFTAKGVQVVFISDSCHSGTLARSLSMNTNYANKYISPISVRKNTENWENVVGRKGRKSVENFNKLFLVIGASLDTQFSLDQGEGRMSMFTENFVGMLDKYKSSGKTFTYNLVETELKTLVEVQSDGTQTPHLDTRFFDDNLLNRPIFSLISDSSNISNGNGNAANGKGKQVRIVVRVKDEAGKPVEQAAFGVFQSNAMLSAGQVKKDDAFILGRTDERGFYDSEKFSKTLSLGKYKIKVVKNGYKAFIQDMQVVESNNGVTVFDFKLVKE